MRLLQGWDRQLSALGVMHVTMKGEGLLFAIGREQIIDKFQRRRFAQVVVEAEWLEIIGINSRHEPELHPTTHDLIDEGNFLGETQWMVQGHDVAHRANTDP